MNEEINFKKNWSTVFLAIGTTIILMIFIVIVQYDSFKNGESAVFFALLIILVLGSYATWTFVAQKFISYHQEGISFRNVFGKRFMKWNDIKSVSISDERVIKLASDNSKLKISLNEYKEPEMVARFIESKVIVK